MSDFMSFVIELQMRHFYHIPTYIHSLSVMHTTRSAAMPVCPSFVIWIQFYHIVHVNSWFFERHYKHSFSEYVLMYLCIEMQDRWVFICTMSNCSLLEIEKKQQRNIESNHWEVAKSFPSFVTLNSAKSQVRLSSVLGPPPCHLNNPMSQWDK